MNFINSSSSTPQKRRLTFNGIPVVKKTVVEQDLPIISEPLTFNHENVQNERLEKEMAYIPSMVIQPELEREYTQEPPTSVLNEMTPSSQHQPPNEQLLKEMIDKEIEQWNMQEHRIKLKMFELDSSFDDLLEKEKLCAGKTFVEICF